MTQREAAKRLGIAPSAVNDLEWGRGEATAERIHDELNGACTRAIEALAAAGLTAEGLDVPLEAGRLHALLDGLALHAVMRPDKVPPSRIVAAIARHLDTLR